MTSDFPLRQDMILKFLKEALDTQFTTEGRVFESYVAAKANLLPADFIASGTLPTAWYDAELPEQQEQEQEQKQHFTNNFAVGGPLVSPGFAADAWRSVDPVVVSIAPRGAAT